MHANIAARGKRFFINVHVNQNEIDLGVNFHTDTLIMRRLLENGYFTSHLFTKIHVGTIH